MRKIEILADLFFIYHQNKTYIFPKGLCKIIKHFASAICWIKNIFLKYLIMYVSVINSLFWNSSKTKNLKIRFIRSTNSADEIIHLIRARCSKFIFKNVSFFYIMFTYINESHLVSESMRNTSSSSSKG